MRNSLEVFSALLTKQSVEVVDLTQTLSADTPVIALPPPFAQTAPFRTSQIARYDDGCPSCYWNNISMGEHTGTHLDAPAHWLSGRQYADGYTDTISVDRLIAPACVIDCSKQAALDESFVLERHHVLAWEERFGRIPRGAWFLMRTDWSKRKDPSSFLNLSSEGPRNPGPSADAIRLLVERKVNGFGVETVGTDAGHAMFFDPPFPCHEIGLGAKLLGLASLTNLDRLPPTGSLLIAAPLKMKNGSGSPVRALALVAHD